MCGFCCYTFCRPSEYHKKLYVKFFIVALNTRTSQTTKKTPFEVVFGQHPNSLGRFSLDELHEDDMGDFIDTSGDERTGIDEFGVDGEDDRAGSSCNSKGNTYINEDTTCRGNTKPSFSISSRDNSVSINIKQCKKKSEIRSQSESSQDKNSRPNAKFTSSLSITLKRNAKVLRVEDDTEETELPTVDFVAKRDGRDMVSDEGTDEDIPTKMARLHKDWDLDQDQEKTRLPPLPRLGDVLFSSSSDEEEIIPERKRYVSPIRIKKHPIDTDDLIKYTRNNIYSILTLPFHKDDFKNSDASDYLDVYEEEATLIESILEEHDPTINKWKVFDLDRLMWMTAEALKTIHTF